MRPLSDWHPPHNIVGVFTDIDDTLTTEGAITPDALQALADLKAAGLAVVPITGRPVGWSEPFVQSWPVDAIVAENGAVGLTYSRAQGLRKRYQQDAETRISNFSRMQTVLAEIELSIPGALRSQDSAGRETDIAIDHSEFTHLPDHAIDAVVRNMQQAGMTATVSSIHINGWFGEHSKLTGARWIVRELWGRDLDAEIARWVYVGDSTNDQVMFAHFPHSVGVANIQRFADQLTHPPRFITPSERGAGFAEVVRQLLS
jgi:HAD superfamily hydrolase (TIGR01484 family)